MGKKKKRAAEYDASVVRALAELRDAQQDARESFAQAFDRLERKTTTKLERIVERAREDADAATASLRSFLDDAQTASGTLAAQVEAEVSQLSAACGDAQQDVDALRALRATSEGLVEHVDAQLASSRERIAAGTQDAAARLEALCSEVQAQLEASAAEAERRHAEIDAACRRIQELVTRAGKESQQLERWQQQAQQAHAEVDSRFAAVRVEADAKFLVLQERLDAALDTVDAAVTRADADIAARTEAVAQRLEAVAAGRIDECVARVSQQSHARADELVAQLDAHTRARVDALLGRADEMEAAAQSTLDDAIRGFEARSAAALQSAVDELLAMVDETRREFDAVADVAAPHEPETVTPETHAVVWTPLADVADDEIVEETIAEDLSVQETIVEELVAEEPVDETPAVEDAIGEERVEAGTFASASADGMWDMAPWARPPEVAGDTFFSRIAAELRESYDDGFPVPEEPPLPTHAPSAAPAADIPRRSVDLLERVAATAPVGPLLATLRQLETGEEGQLVRLDLVKSESATGFAALRVSTFDPRGWWETHALPVTCAVDVDTWIAVDRVELIDALDDHSRFVSKSDARMVFHRDLEVGNHLLLARDSVTLASDPALGERVEHVDVRRLLLDDATSAGVALETQMGRMRVPAAFAASLRRRRVERADLVMVDGSPCLRAPITGATTEPVGVTIVCPLQDLGHDDVADAEERRSRGGEVAQLVVALSANTTSEELAHLLKVGVGYARRRAASHPALPQEMIDDLLRDGTDAMRAAAASNPSLSREGAEVAARDGAASVRAALAASPAVSAELLARLAGDDAAQVRAGAASNSAADPSLLAELANDEEPGVRAAAASHPRTSRETLAQLARDPDSSVGAAVARNASCPSELLTELVGLAPESVLANPSASKALLAAGTMVELPHLRATVATNPTTPPKQLRILARDDEVEVLRAVAEHPATPAAARRRALRRLERRLDDAF